MSLSPNKIIENLMKSANFIKFYLGQNEVFSNMLFRKLLKIRQQDFKVIFF